MFLYRPHRFGPYVYKKLGVSVSYNLHEGDAIRIGFVNKDLSEKQYAIPKDCTNNYFTDFDTTKAVVLGKNDEHNATYIKFNMGKGALYLNTTPLMFSNYSLLQEQGAGYSATALSFLNNRGTVLWDEYYTQGRAGTDADMGVFYDTRPYVGLLISRFLA